MQLFAIAQIAPRGNAASIAPLRMCPAQFMCWLMRARASNARILTSQLDQKDLHNVSGTIDLEIRRDKREEFEKAL